MAQIAPVGTGLAAGPHPTIANLWVREIDQTTTATYPFLILTGVIKNLTGSYPDTTTLTYAHGCVLTQVDGTTSLSAQWENTGTAASPLWRRWSTV